jgi:hypothetical protein
MPLGRTKNPLCNKTRGFAKNKDFRAQLCHVLAFGHLELAALQKPIGHQTPPGAPSVDEKK